MSPKNQLLSLRMNPRLGGLPLFVTGYFALAMVQACLEGGRGVVFSLTPLLLPVVLHFGTARAKAMRLAQELRGSALAFNLVSSGTLLLFALQVVPLSAGLSLLGSSLSLYALSSGALLFIGGVEAPGGLEPHESRAKSRDALVALSVLWLLMIGLSLGRLTFPARVLLSPLALDAALTFACLGSVCLLLAAELRVLILRGLELGTLDRARGGVAILLAALWVTVGAIFLEIAALDTVAELTLAVAAATLSLTKVVPDPTAVARGLRRTLSFLILGGPPALVGVYLLSRFQAHSTWIFIFSFPLAAILGATAEALGAPLRPERGRWLRGLARANQAALDADTQRALINILGLLKTTERRSVRHPEAYALAPAVVLSTDIAGHLKQKPAEFPGLVYELACLEPFRVLRKETLQGLQVRRPDLRPALGWFLSHEAGCAIALRDPDGPLGLLVLPEGDRKSRFTHEEVTLLGQLGDRFAGIIAIHSALTRSRQREETSRALADQEHEAAREMRAALEGQVESRLLDAAILAEPVRSTSLSARAKETLEALEKAAEEKVVILDTPLGIDPLPWAAHLHLSSRAASRPFENLDLTSDQARKEIHPVTGPAQGVPPMQRAPLGTLLVQGSHLLSEEELGRMLHMLGDSARRDVPSRVILTRPRAGLPEKAPTPPGAPLIALPGLNERPEDLQTLILYELSRTSLRERGQAIGIQRAALAALIERSYAGGDAELRGLLSHAIGNAGPGPIRLAHLGEPDSKGSESFVPPHSDEPDSEPPARRSRSRQGPRSRYS